MTGFSPRFWTTAVGSFPHLDSAGLCRSLAAGLEVPDWPQLSRRSFRENMYVQYSAALPAIVIDENQEKISFDTRGDLTPALEAFYERYLADDLDYFGLKEAHAAGFFAMLEAVRGMDGEKVGRDISDPKSWIKGQVTGPISLGLTVTDQDLRASLYDDLLADAILKNAAMNARWQARRLQRVRPNVILAVDEPYMASYGSAYISLSREQVVAMLDEVFAAIHAEGALAWVHCCANTDWSVLLETGVDILNLDAYGYMENLALYPAELRAFLDRGGALAWGIVPNNGEIWRVEPDALARRLRDGFGLIARKAAGRGVEIDLEEFASRSMLTTSCGLGPATVEVADRAMEVLARVGEILKSG